MNLLTKELQTQLDKASLYEQEGASFNAKVLVRFHALETNAVWYVTEASKEGTDYLLFGYCQLQESEWGYTKLGDIETIANSYMVLTDYSCAGKTISECLHIFGSDKETVNYEFFKNYLQQNLATYLCDVFTNAKIQFKEVYKDEIQQTGIIINSDNLDFAPMFYLERLYSDFKGSSFTLDDFFIDLKHKYSEAVYLVKDKITDDIFSDYENSVFACLVPKDSSYLLPEKDVYYEEFLDMAVIYRIHTSFFDSSCGVASAVLTNSLIDSKNIDKSSLRDMILKGNNCFCQYNIEHITDMLPASYLEGLDIDELNMPMYVVSNSARIYGASVMLTPYMEYVADYLNSDYAVLPSSRHEIIVIPEKDNSIAACYKEMVHDVNEMCLAKGDRLTDSVYYYSKNNGLQTL